MNNQVHLTKFFAFDRELVFDYFMDSNQVQKWAAPDGMTLELPLYEGRPGGHYIYEHTDSNGGKWTATGSFSEIVSNERVVSFDDEIRDPSGNAVMGNLETEINFIDRPGGCEVDLLVTGFSDKKAAENCEQGWAECLDKLGDLMSDGKVIDQDRRSDLHA